MVIGVCAWSYVDASQGRLIKNAIHTPSIDGMIGCAGLIVVLVARVVVDCR
jgi:hypothetical protein